MEIQVWNPDKGEDYSLGDFGNKQTFSSLSQGLFVVEATGVDWNRKECRECLYYLSDNALTKNLTVIITPWWTINPWGMKKAFKKKLDKVLKFDYSLPNYIAQCDNSRVFIEKLFEVRKELGGNASGEWLFIGSTEKVRLGNEEIVEGFYKVLDRAADFDFLIFMAEMQQTFLVFKPFANVKSFVKEIEKING